MQEASFKKGLAREDLDFTCMVLWDIGLRK
jgi:hypothetical protein